MSEAETIAGLRERIERLEEGQGFAERAAEGLSAEVYALGRRLEELATRVGRLEAARRAGQEMSEDGGEGARGAAES